MDSSTAIISVIVPVYNSANYLKQCLDNLVNQTLQNIEIICINDGSTDNSLNILQQYAASDSRIKIISQPNGGQARARNTGLKNATGTYVMFCDSDDWYQPHMCERMLATITEKNVDFAVCDCDIIFEQERCGADYHYLKAFGLYDLSITENKEKNQTLVWNKIFKNSLLQKYQILFPENCNVEDVSFIIQCVAVSQNMYGLEEKLYNYRVRSNSVIDNIIKDLQSNKVIASFGYTYDFLVKHQLWQANYDYFIFEYYKQLTWLIQAVTEENAAEFFGKIQQDIARFKFNLKKQDVPHQVFSLIQKGEFATAQAKITGLIKEKIFFNIPYYKVVQNNQKGVTRYYILGLRLFKTKIRNNKKKTYFLFIPIHKKKI